MRDKFFKAFMVVSVIAALMNIAQASGYQLLGSSASLAGPQISGDNTSGLFTPGAARVGITISGSEKLEANATGVTIGTSTPISIFTVAGNEATTAAGRAYNTGTASDTIAAGIASTYESANTAAGAFTVTFAAPKGDGEKREICFANTTGVITWAVTTPATATIGLPTTLTGGGCVSVVYNSVAGTPTNSPATTWVRW